MPVNKDKVLAKKLFGETKPSDLWDQPVLLRLHSVWRVLKLVWSLQCPLLLGVGSAWRRRTGDALVNSQQYYLLPLLLKVLLRWMTLFSTLESVGCRAENEYMINVGSHLAKRCLTVFFFFCLFFFFFFKEMKCRVWCILHMFFRKVNIYSWMTSHFIISSILSTSISNEALEMVTKIQSVSYTHLVFIVEHLSCVIASERSPAR